MISNHHDHPWTNTQPICAFKAPQDTKQTSNSIRCFWIPVHSGMKFFFFLLTKVYPFHFHRSHGLSQMFIFLSSYFEKSPGVIFLYVFGWSSVPLASGSIEKTVLMAGVLYSLYLCVFLFFFFSIWHLSAYFANLKGLHFVFILDVPINVSNLMLLFLEIMCDIFIIGIDDDLWAVFAKYTKLFWSLIMGV